MYEKRGKNISEKKPRGPLQHFTRFFKNDSEICLQLSFLVKKIPNIPKSRAQKKLYSKKEFF